MRKTIIENWWRKEEKLVCVFWNYENGNRPYVTFSGYNPFPFFDKEGKLYTSLPVFNKWMEDNGYSQCVRTTTDISKIVIIQK